MCVAAPPCKLSKKIKCSPERLRHIAERSQDPFAHRLDHGAAAGADGCTQLLKVLVDDAKSAGIPQVAVKCVGLLGINARDHESHHRDRGELAGSEDLARKKFAKERQ